ncbi:MAG TPA: hypothetical protein PKI87_10975 [Arenimonas sp.]|nr:hypothetical protein [Arenimonas sp.]
MNLTSYKFISYLLASLVLLPSSAFAHHGQDFLLIESPAVPHPGSVYLIANAQVALAKEAESEASFAPAILVGVTPRFSFELHTHAEKPGNENWTYEATAPAIHLLLTDPNSQKGLKLGISAEYEFANEADTKDNMEVRFSAEIGGTQTKWGANLIASRELGGNSDFAAALGARHAVRTNIWLGAEIQSSFRITKDHQALLAAYFESRRFGAMKLGVGGKRNELGNNDLVVYLGWVVQLHAPD